jgi:hypothetical protein
VLHYHLTILILLLNILFSLFILLIPTPFVNLWFRKSTCLAYSLTCFFSPGWIFVVFLHKILHLIRIFSISFLFISLNRDFWGNIFLSSWIYLRHFWSSMEWPTLKIDVRLSNTLLVRTKLSYLLEWINEQYLWNHLLSFSIFITGSVMLKVFVLIENILLFFPIRMYFINRHWELFFLHFCLNLIHSLFKLFFCNMISFWLNWSTKCHLLLHWNSIIFILFGLALLFGLHNPIFHMTHMSKVSRNRWHRNRWNTMWSVNHTSSNTLLVLIVFTFFLSFTILGHMLKI